MLSFSRLSLGKAIELELILGPFSVRPNERRRDYGCRSLSSSLIFRRICAKRQINGRAEVAKRPARSRKWFPRTKCGFAVPRVTFAREFGVVFVRGSIACAGKFARGEVNYGGAY
jgi:hypothetical protein